MAVPGSLAGSAARVVEPRRVGVPGNLDRSEIARAGPGSRLEVPRNVRWGEALGGTVSRVLAEDLAQRPPVSTVLADAGATRLAADAAVETELHRFEADPSGAVELAAQAAFRFGPGRPGVARSFRFAAPVEGQGRAPDAVAPAPAGSGSLHGESGVMGDGGEGEGRGEDAGAGNGRAGRAEADVSGRAAGPGVGRRAAAGAFLAGAPTLAAAGCARFPELPPAGAGVPIEADPLFREAMASAPVLPGNEVTPLFGGLQAFTGLFRGIEGARDHVNLEFYILQDVRVPGTDGPSLFGLLREKLRQGVAVTVIYDSFGSKDTPAEAFDALRAAGANLLSVNPLEARGGWRPNRRDHRKVAVADGRVAMTGGINLDHVYENACRRAAAGVPVESAEERVLGRRRHPRRRTGGRRAAAAVLRDLGQAGRRPLPARDWFPPPTGSGRTRVRVLGSAPRAGRPRFYVARMAAVAGARRRVWLCAGYFVPTRRELAELAQAARRGVDVRLLLPGVTDEGVALAAQRASYGPPLEAGVRVWEVRNSVLHAKCGVVDDAWAWVGSSNLDRRSVAWNNEVDAIVLGPEAAEALGASIERVMARAVPVALEDWRGRGVRQRLRELLAWPVADLL